VLLQIGQFNPIPLGRRLRPFSHPDWLFELKYDGFRALAYIDYGRCKLVSRNGNTFVSFGELASKIGRLFPQRTAVLDGEIVCLNKKGHPQFHDLLFRRGQPSFVAFDLLWEAGKLLTRDALLDRKLTLKRFLAHLRSDSGVIYADHVAHSGEALFERARKLDLEGIVAKDKSGPYVSRPEETTWFKIRNRNYSQLVGRADLFERDRHREPVPGWHTCALACVDRAVEELR
jgi:bifunctional non-homologous end joining protein LigD